MATPLDPFRENLIIRSNVLAPKPLAVPATHPTLKILISGTSLVKSFYHPQTKLREIHVFTGIYLFTGGGGVCPTWMQTPSLGQEADPPITTTTTWAPNGYG